MRNFAFLLAVLAVAAFAQDMARKIPALEVAPVAPVSVKRGGSAKVEIDFRVPAGYHINSNQPHDTLLQPTIVKLDPPTDIVVSKLTYPPGKDVTFEFLPGQPLSVYTGDVAVTGLVSTTKAMPQGTFRVRGTLRYQACDNRQCYPPKNAPLEFDVKVVKAGTRTRKNPPQSPHVH